MEKIYIKLAEISQSGQSAALCTIISTKGSTPLKTGGKMVVMEDKKIFGTIGGGKLEHIAVENALDVIRNETPQFFKYDLLNELGMSCGGYVEIFIDPVIRKKKLYIFGAGHVGKAIARHALTLDFDISVIDDRKDIFQDWDMEGIHIKNMHYSDFFKNTTFNEKTFIVITTYTHDLDMEILALCLRKPLAYVGMISSRRKAEITREKFISEGIATGEELDKVDMPVGVDINAEGPDEIAISIIAGLIKEKNKDLRKKKKCAKH